MRLPSGSSERDIERAIVRGIEKYIKPNTYEIILPRDALSTVPDHTFLSDFHYNHKGAKTIASVIAENFKF